MFPWFNYNQIETENDANNVNECLVAYTYVIRKKNKDKITFSTTFSMLKYTLMRLSHHFGVMSIITLFYRLFQPIKGWILVNQCSQTLKMVVWLAGHSGRLSLPSRAFSWQCQIFGQPKFLGKESNFEILRSVNFFISKQYKIFHIYKGKNETKTYIYIAKFPVEIFF